MFDSCRLVSTDFDLEAGQYNILPATFDRQVEADFVLRVIGPGNVSLTPVSEQWRELHISGAWTAGLDGAGKNPGSREKNPKYKFKLSKTATVYIFIAVQIHERRPGAGYFIFKQGTLVGNITFSNGGSPGQSWKLDGGVEYSVMPASFDGGILAPYIISMYSEADIAQV